MHFYTHSSTCSYAFCAIFISGGTFFAKKMRDSRYVTMIDPFTQKYGKWGALQALPAAVSEIFWSASILGALGKKKMNKIN